MTDYIADPYRAVRWASDDGGEGAGAPIDDSDDDDDDGGDDSGDGEDGAGPSRPTGEAGPSQPPGATAGPSGAAAGGAGPSGTAETRRSVEIGGRRLRIVRRSGGARVEPVPPRDEAEAEAEDVPEDEAPAAGGEPGEEDGARAEGPAATAGVAEVQRLIEATVRELFPQVYAEGQPPIQAGDAPRSAGAYMQALAPLVRARDIWVAETQEHTAFRGQLQRELDATRGERDELHRRIQALEAQSGPGGDAGSSTRLAVLEERLKVSEEKFRAIEEGLRGERDRIQVRYDQLVAQMVSRSSRSRTHTHTAATTPRRPRDEESEAGSSRRPRRSLAGMWSPGEGSHRPGDGTPGSGQQQ